MRSMSGPRYANEMERLQACEQELHVALRVIAHLVEADYPSGRLEVLEEYVRNAPDLTAWRENGHIVLVVTR